MMNVSADHLNLWSKRTKRSHLALTTLTFLVSLALLLLALVPPQGEAPIPYQYLYISMLASVALFLACLILAQTRDAILKRWARCHDFDFLYNVQSKARSLTTITLLLTIFSLAAVLLSLGIGRVSSIVILSLLYAPLLLANRTSTVFSSIFSPPTLAMLCLQSYIQNSSEAPYAPVRKHLARGLGAFENTIRRYGVRISKEKLMFAISLNQLSGKTSKEALDNFGSALCTPNTENLSKAIESARRLLGTTKDSMALGLQIPYPFWRRLPTSRMWEATGNIIYVVAVLIPLILYYLLGIHQP